MNLQSIQLNDGSFIPKIGQGTWEMGEREDEEDLEIESIYKGIELGLRLIDTAEMYGDGGAEKIVGKAIHKAINDGIVKREDLYIVSKVYPFNAGKKNIFRCCENSLNRLGVDYLDLYLLHWRGNIPLSETVYYVEDMEELLNIPNGTNCVVNQVLYHIASREAETGLTELQGKYGIPIMAYSPLARAGKIVRSRSVLKNELLMELANKYNCTVYQIMLAFVHAQPNVITIPKSTQIKHLCDNFDVLSNKIKLSQEDLQRLDDEFPAPSVRCPIDMV
ncbi:hypothetical protein PIROE2DRAFT_20770 [Piromyces sp. E2]|nr:hypothetical protein PIROE2DRAFT_20770 [Piromyces sp. E2]|eukprot:OUM62695.1 hypothetical protein PIROE2DRAFT_20770 [Piromyces sp. E2]